jgi:hypothetical protein
MSDLFPDGFTAIRPGLKDHIEGGMFSDRELGIYTFLHLYMRWDSGVIWTCASGIKNTMKNKEVKLRTVQNSLKRMREKEYIDYPKGNGSGGLYPVLILKATVTAGVLKGSRVISFYDEEKQYVLYDISDAEDADAVRTLCGLLYGPLMEQVRSRWGAGAVVVRIQDIKKGRLAKKEEDQDTQQESGGTAKGQKVGL